MSAITPHEMLRDDAEGYDPNFPSIVDDAAPERNFAPDPQTPSLPGDHYTGVLANGITPNEALDGESLEIKLDREVPEYSPFAEAGITPQEFEQDFNPDLDSDADLDYETRLLSDPEGAMAGRLVEPDEGAHADTESDAVATEVFYGENDLSAEELAMHVEFER